MRNTLIGCRTLGGGLALVVFVSCAENGASDETADAKPEPVALTFDEVLAESMEDIEPWLISDGEGGAYFVTEHGAWHLKDRWVEPVVPRPPMPLPRKLKMDPDNPFLKRLRDRYEDTDEATDGSVEAEDGEGSP